MEKVGSFLSIRNKAKSTQVVETPEQTKKEEKPVLVRQKNINTEYSDILDVSKPSKYTEHFLK